MNVIPTFAQLCTMQNATHALMMQLQIVYDFMAKNRRNQKFLSLFRCYINSLPSVYSWAGLPGTSGQYYTASHILTYARFCCLTTKTIFKLYHYTVYPDRDIFKSRLRYISRKVTSPQSGQLKLQALTLASQQLVL